MNALAVAPTAPPADAMVVATAPLSWFAPSLTNRKHTEASIQDLAASLKPDGVLQPITARPWPASRGPAPKGVVYEIVIGEGRWLASAAAKLPDIPFFWRNIDDRTALRMQLIENLKRKDLTAIEEAEGYRRLMKDHGLNADQVAKEIGVNGKSRGYVYARLKLLELCPAAREVYAAGKLETSTALLVARIPVVKLQEQAVKEIIHNRFNSEPMSYRAAQDYIQRTFMLRLADAPFPRADENLLPGVGRCHECPKRTGNQEELFADIKNADICTDPECYAAKNLAHVAAQKAAAKADGRKIIDGAEAKKIKPHQYSDDLAGGYVDLDKKIYSDAKNRTLRQILGKDAPKPDLLIDPHDKGKVIEVVAKATIEEHLAAKGGRELNEITRQGRSTAEKDAARKQKQEVTYRQRLFDRVRSQLTIDFDTRAEDSLLDLREFRLIANRLLAGMQFDDLKRLARLWIGAEDKVDDHQLISRLKKRVEAFERKDCARLMLEAALVGDVPAPSYSDRKPEHLLATAEALKIDAAEIKKGVIAEGKAKAKPKEKPKAAAAAKKVQPKTAKPQPVNMDLFPGELKIGDRVRVNDTVRSPIGAARIGKEGKITGLAGKAFMVSFPPSAVSISFMPTELDKLPAKSAETPVDPTPAAQAKTKDAAEAAPASVKAPKKPAAKKAEASADPAPASPANETAKPAGKIAWPFPVAGAAA